jgi:molybdopterin/thiamine biosynthesis adenylyltransferase
MTLTAAQENDLTLARLVGIPEDQASERLNRRITITHGDGAAAAAFAVELSAQLGRTVQIGEGNTDLEVIVDGSPRTETANHLFVSLQDDRVTISKCSPAGAAKTPQLHGVQTMIAACYAAGVALQSVIDGMPVSSADPFVLRFDALGASRAVLERPVMLFDTVLAGAGAISNGFLRAARHLDIRGNLSIADPKLVGSGNPNRCLYFDDTDIGHPKATRLCAKAQSDFPDLRLDPFDGPFTDLVRSRKRIRRVIVATDSRRVRRSIQQELPLEVLDASTTGVSEIVVHSHRQPTDGACLACIYRHIPDEQGRERDIASGLGIALVDVTSGTLITQELARKIAAHHQGLDAGGLIGRAFDSLFKQLCAEQKLLTPGGEQVLAPFAFVSNLAGALLALELARFDVPGHPGGGSNYLFLSPWAPPYALARRWHDRDPDCEFCSKPTARAALRAVWPECGF